MSETLRELQENFQAYMLSQNDTVLNSISFDHDLALTRINIYRDGYAFRLLEILQKDFPCLRQIMGDEELFEKMGREYIAQYPSNHFSICTFSRHFSNFLAQSD